MFQGLPDETLDEMVSAFERVECGKGTDIISQGDPVSEVDSFYVLRRGKCSVTVDGRMLPDPHGTLSEGTLFGELAMLYDEPRAATISAKTDCTLFRVDRKTFKFFLGGQNEIEDIKAELRAIDGAIDKVRSGRTRCSATSNSRFHLRVILTTYFHFHDKISGVRTRYSGSIIWKYKPQRGWLWRRWRGTVLQHAYKSTLFNMSIAAAVTYIVRRRFDPPLELTMSPDQTHSLIKRLLAFSKHWHYLQGITTFVLTFFLGQSYALWRDMYNSARRIQGRLNDVNFLLASTATRDEGGQYTPEAESCLDDVGRYA